MDDNLCNACEDCHRCPAICQCNSDIEFCSNCLQMRKPPGWDEDES